MAPKRRGQDQENKPVKKRQSKLAKENDINPEEETEIQEAFHLFAIQHEDYEEKEGVLPAQAVRRCLVALNITPSPTELRELKSTLDPTETGFVTYPHFLAVAALKLRSKSSSADDIAEEVGAAFQLFTRGDGDMITLAHLRRVAKELREDVDERVLRDMIVEANGGQGISNGVGMEEFEGVMRRAGVFG